MDSDQRKINSTTFALMLAVAIFIDLIEILLDFLLIGFIFNTLIDVLAWLTFYLWFKLKGVNFSNSKNFLTMATGFIVGLIPFLNILPEWSITVFMVAGFSRAEELAEKVGAPPIVAKTVGKIAQK